MLENTLGGILGCTTKEEQPSARYSGRWGEREKIMRGFKPPLCVSESRLPQGLERFLA